MWSPTILLTYNRLVQFVPSIFGDVENLQLRKSLKELLSEDLMRLQISVS
jgi:hypothetical protein